MFEEGWKEHSCLEESGVKLGKAPGSVLVAQLQHIDFPSGLSLGKQWWPVDGSDKSMGIVCPEITDWVGGGRTQPYHGYYVRKKFLNNVNIKTPPSAISPLKYLAKKDVVQEGRWGNGR